MYGKIQKIHFVGIGGIGMSGIAEVLLNLGYEVRGSDLQPSLVTARLRAEGAETLTLDWPDLVPTDGSGVALSLPSGVVAHGALGQQRRGVDHRLL